MLESTLPVVWNHLTVNTFECTMKPRTVEVRHGDMTKALEVLKKFVSDEKILVDYKRHQAYEKPSDKRRRLKARAVHHWNRERARQMAKRGY